MVCRGNITFQSFECEYDEKYKSYNIDGDIKSNVQVLTDYYTYSGYYMVLNESFWKNLFNCIYWEDITNKPFFKQDFWSIKSQLYENNIPFSCKTEDISNRIREFSQLINIQSNLNGHALFNLINVKQLSLFDDFMEVFFNKQNKKVKKSFLHSYGLNYFGQYFNESRRYDYLNMFEKYFGNKFAKFVDNELEKYDIDEKFSTMNIADSIFSKFSEHQVLAIINRLNLNTDTFNSFKPFLVFNGEDISFIFMWDEFKKQFDDLEVLWIDFLLNLGFNVEIFAFNKSNNSLSRFVNRFKENKIKLEVLNCNSKEVKWNKLMINDFKQLKEEINLLNNENMIIKLNNEEVSFNDVYNVYLCALEKEDNGLSKDYCCNYCDVKSSNFSCKYVEDYFNEFSVNDNFGEVNSNGIWKFNKDNVRNDFQNLVKIMKICPFFEYMSNKKDLTKYLNDINPKTKSEWCFVDDENHYWSFVNNKWVNEECDLEFPGFSKIIGIKKTC